MASKGSKPPSEPARITLTSQEGHRMNVTIGKITNSVSVANRSTVVTGPPQPANTVDQLTTYEQQTQQFEQVMRGLPNRTIDKGTIIRISPHFSEGWRRVFRHLDISDADIDKMFQEGGRTQEVVHGLLVQWTQAAVAADVTTLVEALVRAQQLQLTQFLRD